jgi:hypothetical protein
VGMTRIWERLYLGSLRDVAQLAAENPFGINSVLSVLIGQKKALGIAVRNDRPQRRYSGLRTSLKGKRGTEGSGVESKTASQSRVVS